MKILIACEYSGIVRDAFSRNGHDAWSCDLLPTESELTKQENKHIQGNVLEILNDGWDMMIAHPPCTHLSVSGQRWFTEGKKDYSLQREAIRFVEALWEANIEKIVIENPVSILSTRSKLGRATQTIQPYQFGEPVNKRTCLWLKNLHLLKPTKLIPKDERKHLIWLTPPSKDRGKIRSKTFPGIANAMAEQWGGELL